MEAIELARACERTLPETSLLLRWQSIVVQNARATFSTHGWTPLPPTLQSEEWIKDNGDLDASPRVHLKHDPGVYGPGAVDAQDLAQEWIVTIAENPDLRARAEKCGDAFVARWARWRAHDQLRVLWRSRSIDQIGLEPHDEDGPENTGHLSRSSTQRLRVALSEEAASERAAEALCVAEAEHSQINDEFTARARNHIANSQRLALRAGQRPLIIEALLRRRSLLATMVYKGPRDTDPDAASEAKLIASQTGLTLGRVRNLRLEIIRVLREVLREEIELALDKLASLWGVTRRQAAVLHLRWSN